MRVGVWVAGLTMAGLGAGCVAPPTSPAPPRLGVPPVLESSLATAPWPRGTDWSVASLRPYSRARDLEALLLSTHSKAFEAVVVPARVAPLYGAWAVPLPTGLAPLLRRDAAELLEAPGAPAALPLTLDGPVLIYRADWWRTEPLPPPSTSAGLREALLSLRSWRKGLDRPLQSAVPEAVLLRSLEGCAEGEVRAGLYRYATVHALETMREFALTQRSPRAIASDLAEGRTAAAILNASDAARLLAEPGPTARLLAAVPLPSRAGAVVLYDGWCLMGISPRGVERRHLEALLSREVQSYLAARGNYPAAEASEKPGGQAFAALARTRLVALPESWEETALLEGAIADVLQGGLEPEEALRRAEASRGVRREAAP